MSHLLSHSLNFPLNYCTVPTTVDSRSVAVGQSEMKLRGIASSRQEKPLTLSCLNVRKPNQTWYVLALQRGWIQRCIALFKKSFWENFQKQVLYNIPITSLAHHFVLVYHARFPEITLKLVIETCQNVKSGIGISAQQSHYCRIVGFWTTIVQSHYTIVWTCVLWQQWFIQFQVVCSILPPNSFL